MGARLGHARILIDGLRAAGAIAALLLVAPRPGFADAFPDTVYVDGFEPCVGVQCFQVKCPGDQTTSVSGTVYAPNGVLPLPNVQVYVPSTAVADPVDGPDYDRCGVAPSGHPVAAALTDANGNFTVRNMPATSNVPLVMLAGKWRREITIGNVPQCTNTPLMASDTRLPANHNEGHIPHIAIDTGNADSLECLMRKTGVADAEFGSSADPTRIHLYVGTGVNKIDGGSTLTSATTLWASSDSLSAYDQVMLACEGDQYPATKSVASISALKAYADAGGRVYLAHWQNIWIGGDKTDINHAGAWPTVASWNFSSPIPTSPLIGTVDDSFTQGAIYYAWLTQVGASAMPGTLSINQARQTATGIDANVARHWIYADTTSNGTPSMQYFSFTTPIDAGVGAQKGRVLFTDMHAASGDGSPANGSFPSGGCLSAATSTTPQEKALLYGIFDLQRCVGSTRE